MAVILRRNLLPGSVTFRFVAASVNCCMLAILNFVLVCPEIGRLFIDLRWASSLLNAGGLDRGSDSVLAVAKGAILISVIVWENVTGLATGVRD